MVGKLWACLIFVGTLAVAGCATTQTETSLSNDRFASASEAAVEATARGDAEEVICRRFTRIGTRIPRNLCLTEDEWSRVDAETREAAGLIDQRSAMGNVGAGPVGGGQKWP